MTPAEKPRDAARTLRFANFTSDGKNTTAAPIPVEAPAPRTKSNAGTTFSLSYDDMMNAFWFLLLCFEFNKTIVEGGDVPIGSINCGQQVLHNTNSRCPYGFLIPRDAPSQVFVASWKKFFLQPKNYQLAYIRFWTLRIKDRKLLAEKSMMEGFPRRHTWNRTCSRKMRIRLLFDIRVRAYIWVTNDWIFIGNHY